MSDRIFYAVKSAVNYACRYFWFYVLWHVLSSSPTSRRLLLSPLIGHEMTVHVYKLIRLVIIIVDVSSSDNCNCQMELIMWK